MTTTQFTAAQFTAAIEASDDVFLTYPLVGLSGTAERFNAYDANLAVIVDGLYTVVLNQAAIDRAIAIADAGYYDGETRAATDMLACVLAPIEAFMAVDIPGLKRLTNVVLYIITPAADGRTFGVQQYRGA